MMLSHGILVDGEVVEVELLEWARWFNDADRRVALTKLPDCEVSTVFLGLDHQFIPGGAPLWFETMVFGGEFHEEMDRYTTLEEAMIGHERMVERVRGDQKANRPGYYPGRSTEQLVVRAWESTRRL